MKCERHAGRIIVVIVIIICILLGVLGALTVNEEQTTSQWNPELTLYGITENMFQQEGTYFEEGEIFDPACDEVKYGYHVRTYREYLGKKVTSYVVWAMYYSVEGSEQNHMLKASIRILASGGPAESEYGRIRNDSSGPIIEIAMDSATPDLIDQIISGENTNTDSGAVVLWSVSSLEKLLLDKEEEERQCLFHTSRTEECVANYNKGGEIVKTAKIKLASNNSLRNKSDFLQITSSLVCPESLTKIYKLTAKDKRKATITYKFKTGFYSTNNVSKSKTITFQ